MKAIIAGNAPSLKAIDYTRMPSWGDVFRCNQFYFEDKYYLGKKIKAVFYNPSVFLEQFYTLRYLIDNGEYSGIERIVLSNYGLKQLEDDFMMNFSSYFPSATIGYDVLKNLVEFDAFIKYNELYLGRRITSGIYMCAFAVALGYEEIYLCGIDFYQNGGGAYAFDSQTTNLLKLGFDGKKAAVHTKEFDLKALEMLDKTYKVKFYSLCPDSILSKFIDLAPITRPKSQFILESKPKDYTKDILLPSIEAYHAQNNSQKIFSKNLILQFIKNIFDLPRDIRAYLKYRRDRKMRMDRKKHRK